MPDLESHLHYRIVDVSSVKELARRWFPRAYFNSPPKNGNHRALADIRESIAELRYYREAVFVPAPGPGLRHRQEDRGEARRVPRLRPEARRPRRPPRRKPVRVHPGGPCTLFLGRHGEAPVVVGVAQLVEHLVVVQDVAGSSPVTHPRRSRPSPRETGWGPCSCRDRLRDDARRRRRSDRRHGPLTRRGSRRTTDAAGRTRGVRSRSRRGHAGSGRRRTTGKRSVGLGFTDSREPRDTESLIPPQTVTRPRGRPCAETEKPSQSSSG